MNLVEVVFDSGEVDFADCAVMSGGKDERRRKKQSDERVTMVGAGGESEPMWGRRDEGW